MRDRSLDNDIQYLKGVGPKRAEFFRRLGVNSVRDLINHFPRKHEDRSTVRPIASLVDGEYAAFSGVVLGVSEQKPRKRLTITRVLVSDGTGTAEMVWFNQPYVAARFPRGMRVLAYGRVSRRSMRIQITDVEFEPGGFESAGGAERLNVGRIVPVYALTDGLSQKVVRAAVRSALEGYASLIPDPLPVGIRSRKRFPDASQAYRAAHFPQDQDDLQDALRRLKFEEFFYYQVAMALVKMGRISRVGGVAHAPDGQLMKRFIQGLPFGLTEAQKRAISEICADMEAQRPMNRLLQGDVGSGKTVVAAAAIVKAVESGYQAAMMAPTEILSEQHHAGLNRLLAPLSIRVALLSGGQTGAARGCVLKEAETGLAHVVVGTHALIQEGVRFRDLSLVITDEQHRFGVRQRAMLQAKGRMPDVLVMTATPIPRTLALTLFGDLDVSTLDEMPPGRKPVKTYWRTNERRADVYAWVKRQVMDGRQAYVVCPLIEGSDKVEAEAATELREELASGPLSGLNVGLLHGRMGADAKREVMDGFRSGKVHVLVSTTVVEVGVDVPNATIMVIEGADRFGLAQLHQLRGRVGRGTEQSYCILLANPRGEEARRRMEIMTSTADGFRIAEADLQMRGPGEFFGTRQHGLPEFRLADPLRDIRLAEEARDEAIRLIEADPCLAEAVNAGVKMEVFKRFKHLGLSSIG